MSKALTTKDVNSGGRVSYDVGTDVRVMGLDGSMSEATYEITSAHSDRKGLVDVSDGMRSFKVHHRRLAPADAANAALVVHHSGKCCAFCPKCSNVCVLTDSSAQHGCSVCGDSFDVCWSTNQQHLKMASANEVDLAELASVDGVELWTKKVPHDSTMSVRSCVVLMQGRKMFFNLYGKSLGKGKMANVALLSELNGSDQSVLKWHAVCDYDAEVRKLIGNGYAKHRAG